MRTFLDRFLENECGAVTVDWVVLAASVVGLGVGTVSVVRTGAGSVASGIDTTLSGAAVASLGTLGDDAYTGPWVAASGRGTSTSSYQCARGGGCWRTTYTTMSYIMEDGSTWQMRVHIKP